MLGQGEEANPGCLYDAGAGHRGTQQATSFLYFDLCCFSGFLIFLTTCKLFVMVVQHIEDAALLTGFHLRDDSDDLQCAKR